MDATRFTLLLDSLRRGEESAVQELVDEYQEPIRREIRFTLLDHRLRRIVGESDILQSVLMRFCLGLWAGNLDADSPEQLVGLLKTMVRARVVDWVRYSRAQRRDVRRDAYLEPEMQSQQPAPQQTPSQLASQRELISIFRSQLSPEELQILDLRQQQLGWQEIALKLGAPSPDAVRKRYERAMEQALKAIDFH